MTALERLEELLDQKDARIEELEEELQDLQNVAETDWEWTRPRTLKDNPENLPVPRLEMRWHKESDDGCKTRWDYWLIYRHTIGHLVGVPLGRTRVSGTVSIRPIWPNGTFDLPFRDGVHICEDTGHLGIPAFGIAGHTIVRLMLKDGKVAQEPYVAP